jgi:hypothetical protein
LPILPLFEHLATRDVADLAVFAGMSMSAMPRFVPILPQFAFVLPQFAFAPRLSVAVNRTLAERGRHSKSFRRGKRSAAPIPS